MKKRALSLFLSGLMLLTCVASVSASGVESNNVMASEYKETHFQINFSDYDVNVSNNTMHLVSKTQMSMSSNTNAEENLDNLAEIFEIFPDVEENLINDYQEDGELFAVSFTEVPLMYVDGHYERVPINDRGYDISDESGKGKFLMYTTIMGGTEPLAGEYEYYARTYGSWSNNLIGGENYPDAGEDYVFQTSPNTFARELDQMIATYDGNPTAGVSGVDFWRENGDSTYVRYALEDDPVGYRQCKNFVLMSKSSGPQSKQIRQIGSYYIHTWAQMALDVSVDISTEKAVTLSINPGLIDKSWQAYNYVTFDF